VTDPKKSAPKNRKAPLSPARKAAFDVLIAVEKGHSHSDDLLRGKAVNALSAADRNLATTLVLGVLRWQIRLDYELRALLKHPGAKLEPEVLIPLCVLVLFSYCIWIGFPRARRLTKAWNWRNRQGSGLHREW
jgi:hypothetical protein